MCHIHKSQASMKKIDEFNYITSKNFISSITPLREWKAKLPVEDIYNDTNWKRECLKNFHKSIGTNYLKQTSNLAEWLEQTLYQLEDLHSQLIFEKVCSSYFVKEMKTETPMDVRHIPRIAKIGKLIITSVRDWTLSP